MEEPCERHRHTTARYRSYSWFWIRCITGAKFSKTNAWESLMLDVCHTVVLQRWSVSCCICGSEVVVVAALEANQIRNRPGCDVWGFGTRMAPRNNVALNFNFGSVSLSSRCVIRAKQVSLHMACWWSCIAHTTAVSKLLYFIVWLSDFTRELLKMYGMGAWRQIDWGVNGCWICVMCHFISLEGNCLGRCLQSSSSSCAAAAVGTSTQMWQSGL